MKGLTLGIRESSRWLLAGFALVVLFQLAAVLVLGDPGGRHLWVLGIGLAVGFPLGAVLLFQFPRQVLMATPILILIPLQIAALHAFEWVFLAALGAYVLRTGAQGEFRLPLRWIDLAFLVYLVWAVISVTQAVDTKIALVGLKTLIIFFLAFQAGSRILGRRSIPQLLPIYALVAVGVALEVMYVLSIRGYSLSLLAGRMGWLTDVGWGTSNYLAAVSSLAACVGLPVVFLGRGWRRTLAIVAVGAAAIVCLATISRGGILALAAGLALAAVFMGRRNLGLVVLLGGGIAAAYFSTSVGQLGVARFERPTELSSIGARFLFFGEAIRIIRDHPIFGVGPDQIPFHTYFYIGPNPHNVFLKNAVDLGLVGLGLYLLVVAWIIRRWWALRPGAGDGGGRLRWMVLFLALSVAFLNASYEPTLVGPQYGFLFWLLVGAFTAPRPAEGTSG